METLIKHWWFRLVLVLAGYSLVYLGLYKTSMALMTRCIVPYPVALGAMMMITTIYTAIALQVLKPRI